MKSTFFSENPIDTLLIRNREKGYVVKKYLEGIDFTDKTIGFDISFKPQNKDQKQLVFVHQSYPETWKDSYERAVEVQK